MGIDNQRESLGRRDLIDLLIMQPTPFCNINCDYCYLPDRGNRERMPGDVIDNTIDLVLKSGLVNEHLNIVWHAGEPLAVPIAFYEDAFIRIGEKANQIKITHSIQTNGTILDQRWCDLFLKNNVHVGISLDGPAFIHDRHRKDRQGIGTHSRVMRGIEALKSNSIPFHAIAVVTADSLSHPDEIFDFFLNLGAYQVGFNIEELEGTNCSSSLSDTGKDEVLAFFQRVYELQQKTTKYLPIREFDRAFSAIANVSPSNSACGNQQNEPFGILSIDYRGNISTFSPELLGSPSKKYNDFVLGNVRSNDLESLLQNPIFLSLATEIHAGVRHCAAECEYFAFCGGGAPANKFYENGDFSSVQTMYCQHSIQIPIEIVLCHLEEQLGLVKSRPRNNWVERVMPMNVMEGIVVSRRGPGGPSSKLVQISK